MGSCVHNSLGQGVASMSKIGYRNIHISYIVLNILDTAYLSPNVSFFMASFGDMFKRGHYSKRILIYIYIT